MKPQSIAFPSVLNAKYDILNRISEKSVYLVLQSFFDPIKSGGTFEPALIQDVERRQIQGFIRQKFLNPFQPF